MRLVSILYTLAYPVLSHDDALRVEAIRREHDPQFGVVAAHFTLLFACDAIDQEAYAAHVGAVSRAVSPIHFVCRNANLSADDAAGLASVFLFPDEGYGDLSSLHDALYRGPLAPHRRLDLPFVPQGDDITTAA